MLDSLAGGSPSNIIGYGSLHSAYSATGSNELAGGSPAYARQALSWSAAAGESKALASSPMAYNVPGSSTVAWIGLWSALSGGTFSGMGANGGQSQYITTAAVSGNLFVAPGSGYGNGATVVLLPSAGSTTPGGFTIGTIYYVVGASGASFQLAATSGGSAITVTAAGSALVQGITVETFSGGGGTFTMSADLLSMF
jgi:hypothetical protein